jgi:hypothetical protein
VINRYTGNTLVYAYYSSGYSDLPGRITLKSRSLGASVFSAISSRGTAFTPNLTVSQAASNQTAPNQIAISKFQQPEAVPLLQNILVGSADKSILRVIALRDYVLIFKQDGVYQIVGTDISSFAAQEVDKTTLLRGIETAVALNNKVFCFTNQTIISMTFNEGAILKSLPIKKDLLILSSPQYPNFDTISFGVAYESDNKFILGTVTSQGDTNATQFYVYNYLTDSWTSWQFPVAMNYGFVNPTDTRLYWCSASSSSKYVYQERKDFAETDFADNSYPVTVTSYSGTTVNVNSTADAVVGYALHQGSNTAFVTQITSPTSLIVSQSFTWLVASATLYKPIDIVLRFVPEAFGNPGIVKHFKEVHAIFSTADFESFRLGFFTDFYNAVSEATLIPKITTGWGLGPWGAFPWGGGTPALQVIRGYVPMSQRRGHWLNVTVNYSGALTNFALDGLVFFYQSMAQKFH